MTGNIERAIAETAAVKHRCGLRYTHLNTLALPVDYSRLGFKECLDLIAKRRSDHLFCLDDHIAESPVIADAMADDDRLVNT